MWKATERPTASLDLRIASLKAAHEQLDAILAVLEKRVRGTGRELPREQRLEERDQVRAAQKDLVDAVRGLTRHDAGIQSLREMRAARAGADPR